MSVVAGAPGVRHEEVTRAVKGQGAGMLHAGGKEAAGAIRGEYINRPIIISRKEITGAVESQSKRAVDVGGKSAPGAGWSEFVNRGAESVRYKDIAGSVNCQTKRTFHSGGKGALRAIRRDFHNAAVRFRHEEVLAGGAVVRRHSHRGKGAGFLS